MSNFLGGVWYHVVVRMMQAGQIVENVLTFATEQAAPAVQAYYVGVALLNIWQNDIMPLLSESMYLLDVSVAGTRGSGNAFISAGLLPGGVTGDALPQFVCVACTKFLNATQEGIDAGVTKPGSMRLAGIPEAVQANGQITDATFIADLNIALSGLTTITGLVGQTSDIRLVVYTPSNVEGNNTPRSLAPVDSFVVNRLSTQNTRKR